MRQGALERAATIPEIRTTETPWEIFRVFLKLGLTSFGGPVAHLGYFRDELVLRRGWVAGAEVVEIVGDRRKEVRLFSRHKVRRRIE